MANIDARIVKSRRALLDAGMELLLQNPGVSLSQIASHAGVGRATLYRHFETRDELIQALAIESLETIEQSLHPEILQCSSARSQIELVFNALMPLGNRYHFLVNLWNIAAEDPEVMKTYQQQAEQTGQMIEWAKQEGSIAEEVSTEWIVFCIDSLLFSGWQLIANGTHSAEQASALAIRTLFHGTSPQAS